MESNKIQYREGVLAIVGNLILFALKLWAGLVAHSSALIADAWHTLSDSFSSIIVLFAAKVSTLPADNKRPFGYGRASVIAGLLIGTLIAFIGFSFLKEGVTGFNEHKQANFGVLAISVTVFSILVKEAMAQYAFWGYKQTNDQSLKADGWHHRSDALSSVIVLIGILVGKGFWWMDSLLSIFVALLLMYASYSVIKESIDLILGEQPSKSEINQLIAICDGVLNRPSGLHHIHVHRYGKHTEVTFHLVFQADKTIASTYAYIKQIEDKLKSELNMAATIRIDLEEENKELSA